MANSSSKRLGFSASRHELTTDEELVVRIQQGDQQAWAAFLERYTDLIYGKARRYARTAQNWQGVEEWEDEVADLYLFMAESVRRSLRSFRHSCKPGTWVLSIVNNRRQVLKAYLLHKDPGRADVRLPKVLESCSQIDQEIFRRLVWGQEPARIALDLEMPAHQSLEVEALLLEHSPRVYARILANRQARKPRLNLDEGTEEAEGPQLHIAHPGPDPEERMEQQDLHEVVQDGLVAALQLLSVPERRVLALLYNQELTASQIAELAATDQNLGLEITHVNRVYYLKDRALDRIVAQIVEQLEKREGQTLSPEAGRRELFKLLEELLQEQGIPLHGA